jgi:hypothetical protein
MKPLIRIMAERFDGSDSTAITFSIFPPSCDNSDGSYRCRVLFSQPELDTSIVGDSSMQAIALAYRFANTILGDLLIKKANSKCDNETE